MTADQPAPGRSRLSRITPGGDRRRADLVPPPDEALVLLVPDLVALVDGRAGTDPGGYRPTTVDGTAHPAAGLHDAGAPDGALVRLDPVSETPPSPILHDVADDVPDGPDGLRGRWDAAALRATATAAAVAGALVGALAAVPVTGPLGPLVAGTVLAAVGTSIAANGHRAPGVALLLAGSAGVLVAVPPAVPSWPLRWMAAAATTAVVVAVLGMVTGRTRGGLIGAAALTGHLLLWWGFGIAGMTAAHASAVIAVVAIGALGVLPRIAVVASGLAGLDDRQAGDEPVARVAAHAALQAAHGGLVLACLATAVSGGLAGWVLAADGDGWGIALAATTAAALLLRLRAFPLTVEVVALVGAALTVAAGLALRLVRDDPGRWWVAVLAALAAVAVAVAALSRTPAPHQRARARQIADRVESLVVIAAIPVVLGVLGVYQPLLATF